MHRAIRAYLVMAAMLAAADADAMTLETYRTVCTDAMQQRPDRIFGAASRNSCHEMMRGYRQFALKWHPDKNPDGLMEHEQNTLFQCVNTALNRAKARCRAPRQRSYPELGCMVLVTWMYVYVLRCLMEWLLGTRPVAAAVAAPQGIHRSDARMRVYRHMDKPPVTYYPAPRRAF